MRGRSVFFFFCGFVAILLHAEPGGGDPRKVLDGAMRPALVTWGTAPGGCRAALQRRTGWDSQLLRTPSSSPSGQRENRKMLYRSGIWREDTISFICVCGASTSGWKGWQVSGRLLSFCIFSLSHLRDSLCADVVKAITENVYSLQMERFFQCTEGKTFLWMHNTAFTIRFLY